MSTVVVGTVRSNSSNPPAIQNTSGTEIGTFCRAWVNFNGTLVTNPASMTGVRGSFNVSSILDNSTGNYTINFTTAMPDVNYAATVGGCHVDNNTLERVFGVTTESFTTSSVKILSADMTSGSALDVAVVSVAIFR